MKKKCSNCGQIVDIDERYTQHGYPHSTENNDVGGSIKMEIYYCGDLIPVDEKRRASCE